MNNFIKKIEDYIKELKELASYFQETKRDYFIDLITDLHSFKEKLLTYSQETLIASEKEIKILFKKVDKIINNAKTDIYIHSSINE